MGIAQADAQEIPSLRGLSRTDLLEVRNGHAASVADWESRRQEAVEAFLKIMGPLPKEKKGSLQFKVLEEADVGSYVRQLITYESTPGGVVPAYLCLPKTALAGRPAPAVLCLHPTENHIGHQVVVGLGGKPNRQYAAELAEQGFVTLSPSYPLLAHYQPDLKALGFTSGTQKAVWDNIRGLDLLESLPEVHREKGFAAIGHSLGGHNAIYTAVLDARVRVIISSCGFDSFLDYKDGNLKGWTQERYMPAMATYLGRPAEVPFDFYELVACLAPRRFFVNAPLHDSNFKWQSVDRIAQAARAVYALHGAAEDAIILQHPDCGHDFPDTQRMAAYSLIRQELGAP